MAHWSADKLLAFAGLIGRQTDDVDGSFAGLSGHLFTHTCCFSGLLPDSFLRADCDFHFPHPAELLSQELQRPPSDVL